MKQSNKLVTVLADTLLYFFAIFLTLKIRSFSNLFIFTRPLDYSLTNEQFVLFAVALPLYLISLYVIGVYEEHINNTSFTILTRGLVSNGIVLLGILLSSYFSQAKEIPRSLLTVFVVINFALFFFNKIIKQKQLRQRVHRILIIGDPEVKSKLFTTIKDFKAFKIDIAGFVTPDGDSSDSNAPFQVLGAYADLNRLIIEHDIDVAFIVSNSSEEKETILKNINYSTYKRTRLYATPSNYEILLSAPKYIRIHDVPLIKINKSTQSLFAIKRILDVVGAIIATVLLSPLFLVVYLLVKITSPGPAVFKQQRVGRDQELFVIHKFRTMYIDFEDRVYQAEGEKDKRLTPVGLFLRKSRLDELPQLFNIIKGDMSFIGPRPLVEKEVQEGLEANIWYKERFSILPGITGLAQVHGDYYTGPEEKMKYDLWYVFHYTPYMDISIIFRTLKIIFLRAGS